MMNYCKSFIQFLIEKLHFVIALIACSFLVAGIVLLSTLPPYAHILEPLSETSWRWNVTKYKITRQREVYLYNWTNVNDWIRNGDTPFLEEVGPYVFEEFHEYKNVTWSKRSMKYNRMQSWKFIPQDSADADGIITNVNALYAVMMHEVSNYSDSLVRRLVAHALDDDEEYIVSREPASKWMFSGFIDKLSEIKYSHFQNTNGSLDGLWTRSLLDKHIKWKYTDISRMRKINVMHDFEEGEFDNGELFLELIPHLCSEARLHYSKKINNRNLMVVRYEAKEVSREYLRPVEDIASVCAEINLPFITTLPSYKPEPNVKVVSPKTAREPYAEIEEITGLVLESRLTYETNIKVQPVPWLKGTFFGDLKEVEIPMIWWADTTKVSQDVEEDIKSYYILISKWNTAIGLTVPGVLLLTSAIIFYFVRRKLTETNNSRRLLDGDETEQIKDLDDNPS